MTTPQKPHGPLRSFGRLKARPLKTRQAALFDSLLPKVAVPDEGPLSIAALKPDAARLWVEIGFGGGEHMAAQAARNPDALVLGAEPFVNGVASALRHLEEGGLDNVRVWQGDAREMLARIADATVERVFIMFPDPWPKARHNKRRLVQAPFVAELARVIAPGGSLRFATDWADYAEQTAALMAETPLFETADDRDPSDAPADHVTTRYEEKKLGDIAPVWFDWVRRS
jgi:tRNA (guanine-N7-)-methyltransferase